MTQANGLLNTDWFYNCHKLLVQGSAIFNLRRVPDILTSYLTDPEI